MSATTPTDFNQLRARWGVYRPQDLKDRCAREGPERFLIDGLIAERSLGLVVGESGLGKSPLMYQIALCAAAGIPFLGAAVQQARVLYLDFENGYRDVNEMIAKLCGYLGLTSLPDDLCLWNVNDCPTLGATGHEFWRLAEDLKPGLVIIDPISALCPEIEKSNSEATEDYQGLRRIVRSVGCSIVSVHHLRKDSEKTPPASLEKDLRGFLQRVRGASVLVNGSDVRLGVARPETAAANIDLIMRGYSRVRGEIPTWRLSRIRDANGEPVGYVRATGVTLLCHTEQKLLSCDCR